MDYDCLIVDDEKALASGTAEYFRLSDISAATAFSVSEAEAFWQEHTCRVLLLDINLGDGSGFELCKKIRSENTDMPIVFISARTAEQDQILAFSLGGDDYVAKPYSLSILSTKVRLILRRLKKENAEDTLYTSADGRLILNPDTCRVHKDGEEVILKALEYKLLAYLVENRGRIIPKQELFKKVWEDNFTGDGTLNVHIRHLRTKIEDNPDQPEPFTAGSRIFV